MNVAKIITSVQLALIGLTALLCVRALMIYFTPQSAWSPLTPASGAGLSGSGSVSGPSVTAGRNRGVIDTAFDPFHRNVAARAPVNLGEDAPETSLDLTLKGKRVGENGMAILRTPDGKQSVYHIGEEILSGVTLEAVNLEFIVISQDGRLERLTYEKNEENSLRQTPNPTQDSSQGSVPSPQETNYSPNSLLNSINFTAERVNNQVTGYRISPKQAGFDSALLGLQDGDIITSIGRIGLQDEGIDLGLILTRLQGSRSTNVELIRNGQEISVKIGTP